ncbi:MAG: DNA-binding response regulator [Desulfobacteraceae bacterium]|nr:MAG: DNA-binding response regulator [Desulfobacteraceae bacterium]
MKPILEQKVHSESIFIIDDDARLNALLTRYLADFGYRVRQATDPTAGLKKIESRAPDLVILDIMLPGMNGFEVLKRLRQFSRVPVIMLTARGDLADRVTGLELGADDYLPKPFEPRELVARIQAVLRRVQPSAIDRVQHFGRLTVDFGRRQVLMDHRDAELTTNEFLALQVLLRRPGEVVDRDQILQELRGMDSDAFNRSADITMSRLRQKLGDDPKRPEFIKTIWGAGYAFIGKSDDPQDS